MNNLMENGKLYQDQIYGTKVLTRLAVAVMDTPEFQRLNGIRQLGFTNISYRGAEHTRFAHSVGTYLVSRTIMRRIVQNHERLGLSHPGEHLAPCFRLIPPNSYPADQKFEKVPISHQSLWRGLTEVVSIAALLHDVGHVPFGHTLEDEFTGIYEPHDKLAGPRLYEMLFNERSELRKVFSDLKPQWIGTPGDGISNEELARLIYVILSWKESVEPPTGFLQLLDKELKNSLETNVKERLTNLMIWYNDFTSKKMFHPFMSDIIGNTICADLLDYLPRDRMNLGMEYRVHTRLQRYLTIRTGTLYPPDEGLRVSIMVTRPARGGQRKDVATAVMDIIRERYEMAERVYYHHKKAAVSTMLAKLVEICENSSKPADDGNIYPAPWTNYDEKLARYNTVHFTDSSLIDYLGHAEAKDAFKLLQKQLYLGIKFHRKGIYRTLLVIDTDLVHQSEYPISHFTNRLRGRSSDPRHKLEAELAAVAGEQYGSVLIYCPSSKMQSKEVNARLEIIPNRVLPLRVQSESFTYHQDVKVLEQYYLDLWRIYVFVSPDLFDNSSKCQLVVDKFIEVFKLPRIATYTKVRTHNFTIDEGTTVSRAFQPIRTFLGYDGQGGLPFSDTPSPVLAALLERAANDKPFLVCIKSDSDPMQRISGLFHLILLEKIGREKALDKQQKVALKKYIETIESGGAMPQYVNRGGTCSCFTEYEEGFYSALFGNETDNNSK